MDPQLKSGRRKRRFYRVAGLIAIWALFYTLFKWCDHNDPVAEASSEYNLPQIHIECSDKQFQKLVDAREEALQRGYLLTNDEGWAKAKIVGSDGQLLSVKMRLKGDLLDHVEGEKWSFRVKVRDGKAWNGMRSFSLQHPKVREYLNEWLYHRFLQAQDVLCPRYEFVHLYINGESKGIYACEEHFDKQLVEHRSRREGPIVKFSEDGMWAGRYRANEAIGKLSDPHPLTDFYESSTIEAFKQTTLEEDSVLYKQFLTANQLMNQYKFGTKTASELFDVEKLARYYAAVDVFQAQHGLFWNNQRFYFNPVLQKLEPIAYDGFSYAGNWTGRPLYGAGMYNPRRKYTDGVDVFYANLFVDSVFMAAYARAVYDISDASTVDRFFTDIQAELDGLERCLQSEFTEYVFDRSVVPKHAVLVHSLIMPYNQHSVKASISADGNSISVINHHRLPIQVVGTGGSKKEMIRLAKPVILPVQIYFQEPFVQTDIAIATKADTVYYQLLGMDTVFATAVSRVPVSLVETPQQRALMQFSVLDRTIKGLKVVNQQVLFQGAVAIDRTIVVPTGYTVIISEGTTMDFTKGAGFISYSPIISAGSESSPITIQSSDYSGTGFTVLQAKETSQLKYTNFLGWNTLKWENWQLTGAVTFYESDVSMINCILSDNRCEDMLNIVRAKLTLDQVTIANTFADGLDVDFGAGIIRNMRCQNTGNDGMDFSGSTITVDGVVAKNIGDKGVSVGEQSMITAYHIRVEGANIGMASKDLSELNASDVELLQCKTGFTAFEKKPEFGPARMLLRNNRQAQVDTVYKVQERSSIIVEGKQVQTSIP